MKAILPALALVVATVASFAQGIITIGNDATHLIVDANGVAISQATGWNNLSLELWGGAAPGSLTLQTTIVGSAIGNPAFADGRINNALFTLPGLPGGVTTYLQLRFLDNRSLLWMGVSTVFTMVPGSFAPNSIVLPGSPSFSTWAAGDLIVGVPEPSSLALAGVAAASRLLFRRRR